MGIIEKYICIFFIYSFLGWFMETFGGYIRFKKMVNRGFLIGPYCPVYGIGVVLITAFLSKYVNDLGIMFCMSILICGILEYFTSYIMEKIFNARWWDYHNRKFNINGRICLETLIPFGIVGTYLVKFANPFFLGIISKIPSTILQIILAILVILIIIDFIVSLKVILNFRKTTKQIENSVIKDNTEEISEMVKNTTTERVSEFKENITDKLNETLEDFAEFQREFIIKVKIFKRKVHFTSKRIYKDLKERELENKRKNASNILKQKIEKSYRKLKDSTDKIKNELKVKLANSKEYTELVKEKFLKKSKLSKRLTEAFPNLEVKTKLKFKNKDNKKK